MTIPNPFKFTFRVPLTALFLIGAQTCSYDSDREHSSFPLIQSGPPILYSPPPDAVCKPLSSGSSSDIGDGVPHSCDRPFHPS